MQHYTLDATNKKLGRIATEAADLLRGKNSPDYTPNILSGNTVTIVNASKIDFSEARRDEIQTRYSGYPGGLTEEKKGRRIERLGYDSIFRHAIRGMLPDNRLRQPMLNNLIITE